MAFTIHGNTLHEFKGVTLMVNDGETRAVNGTTGICTAVDVDSETDATVYYTFEGRCAGTSADMLPASVYVKKDNKGNAVKVIVR